MDKIKVLQLGKQLSFGGTETVMLNIIESLSNDNAFDVFVCSSGGELEEKINKCKVKMFNIENMSSKKITTYFDILKKIRAIIKDENIDIIHSHHRILTVLANIAKIGTGTELIHTAHYMSKSKLIGKFLGNNIIAVGNMVKDNLINESKIDKDKISIIYNGVTIGKNINNNLYLSKSDRVKVICISRISYEKGVDILIKAASEVCKIKNNIEFIVVGDGEERDNIEKLILDLKVEKYVSLVGFKINTSDYINMSDFLILTSRTEGLPITPLECFSQSKTIIATNVGGVSEIVIDNFNGILVDSEDINSIATKIIELSDNLELRKKLELNAYKTVKDNYSVEKMNYLYKEYYKKVMRGKND